MHCSGPLKLPQKIGGGAVFIPGKKILGNQQTETTSRSLAWLDVGTATLEQVFDPPRAPRVFCVSDEGTQIAFALDMDIAGEQTGVNGPQMDVFLVPALGGEPRKLTRFPSRIFDMSWSGIQLYFSTDVGGVHNDVWTLAIDRPERPRRMTSGHADEDRASLSAMAAGWFTPTTARMPQPWPCAADYRRRAIAFNFQLDLSPLAPDFQWWEPQGRPLTARLSIQQEGGKYLAPPASALSFRVAAHFSTSHAQRRYLREAHPACLPWIGAAHWAAD
jgi:hypothetical protein